MAHKTLIDGTAYEISGGKTLVNGTAYSIDKGKTLVGGTAYEVGFDNGMRTITITRDYDGGNSAEIFIGDDRYCDGGSCWTTDGGWGAWTSPITLVVPVGTQMYFENEYEDSYVRVIVNGSEVLYESSDYICWPEWPQKYTITKNTTFVMSRLEGNNYDRPSVYTLTITEE